MSKKKDQNDGDRITKVYNVATFAAPKTPVDEENPVPGTIPPSTDLEQPKSRGSFRAAKQHFP